MLVINAGKQVYQESIQDITTEQFDRTYKTNVYAMFWLSKAALEHLPAGGSIINVTSIQGYSPSPGLLDYASTKWAIIGFTKALAKQVIKDGVRVNAVAPGPFWTPLQPSGGQPQDNIEEFGASVPLRAPWPAGRDRADVRVPGDPGVGLQHRRGVRVDGRRADRLAPSRSPGPARLGVSSGPPGPRGPAHGATGAGRTEGPRVSPDRSIPGPPLTGDVPVDIVGHLTGVLP